MMMDTMKNNLESSTESFLDSLPCAEKSTKSFRNVLGVILFAASFVCMLQAGVTWASTTSSFGFSGSNDDGDHHHHSILLKKHFHPGKTIHHGRVDYKVTDDPVLGRTYTRQFTAACAYGILAFSIGPAQDYAPYQLDVYNDEYAYSDNEGMCLILPSYKGTESRQGKAYWNPNDPTEIVVPFNEMTKISTVIPDVSSPKPLDDDAASRCGDYVIIGKGNFYSAPFYQALKHKVNSWKVGDSRTVHDMVIELSAEM